MSRPTEEQRTPIPIATARRRRHQGHCPLCGRHLDLTFHHLIPKKLHRRSHFRRRYSRELLAQGIYICRECHDGIHRAYTEMELARDFATPESLHEDETLSRHFQWLARQQRTAP